MNEFIFFFVISRKMDFVFTRVDRYNNYRYCVLFFMKVKLIYEDIMLDYAVARNEFKCNDFSRMI